MSMSFDNPMNEVTKKLIEAMYGEDIAAIDDKMGLIDNMTPIHSKEMRYVAHTAKQPATVTIHDEGDIVEMSDGTKYRVGPNGWRRFV